MELFSIPGVGGIIEKNIDGIGYILVQDRYKDDAKTEAGLIEIPAGKIREFENIFDCFRREIRKETGLEVTYIEGENQTIFFRENDYNMEMYAGVHLTFLNRLIEDKNDLVHRYITGNLIK